MPDATLELERITVDLANRMSHICQILVEVHAAISREVAYFEEEERERHMEESESRRSLEKEIRKDRLAKEEHTRVMKEWLDSSS